jgi:hypothetical protein
MFGSGHLKHDPIRVAFHRPSGCEGTAPLPEAAFVQKERTVAFLH